MKIELKWFFIPLIIEENQKLHAIIRGIVEDVEDLKKRMNNTEEQMAATNIRVDTAEKDIEHNDDQISSLSSQVQSGNCKIGCCLPQGIYIE